MSILGTRVARSEDPRLLTDGGVYAADLRDPRLDGAVHVTFVRSTVAHADITVVDGDEARAMPGVVDVIVGPDVDLRPLPGMANREMRRPLLAVGRVRFVGEPVAVVLSETPEHGVDAAERVVVDYEPLPAVVDPVGALGDDTVLFPDVGTNLVASFGGPGGDGDGEDGDPFAGCEVVVRHRIVNQRVAACPIEGRASAVAWLDGRLVQWCSTQNAHGLHEALTRTYGLDATEVRVITPDVGGGFGAKIGGHPEDLVLGWLARRCGRPVRWTETRTENMTSMVHGRAQVHDVAIGGRRDGTIEAYHLDIVQDAGAYPAMGAVLPYLTRLMAAGTYAVPTVTSRARVAVTNTTPVASFRGAGRPEATAAVERAVDLFAAEIGLDPADVRRRNLVPRFDEAREMPTGVSYDCGDYPEALERVLAAAGYDELRADQARRRDAGDHRALGIGIASYVEVTTGPSAGSEYARVEIGPSADGGVEAIVATGASPHGQGLYTALAMVVAHETGLPVEAVRVVHGDTDEVARGTGTFGSRSLQLGGSAVVASTRTVIEDARRRAADQLEAAVEDVVLDAASGHFHVAGTPAVRRGWAHVVAVGEGKADGADRADGAGTAGGAIVADGDFTAGHPTYPFGAHVAVVEVDTDTGDVRLLRLVACDDAGRIVNPLLADGQLHGGLAQGAAQALYEQVRFDADGNPLTTNFADYAVVSATELPSFELVHMATPTWVNPLGAKGIGESGTIGSTPAVQNAVCDALAHLGVRHVDMPCTPERVWRAIAAANPTGT